MTRDGNRYDGALRLEHDQVVVRPPQGESLRVPFVSLRRAVFIETRPSPGPETAGSPRSRHGNEQPRPTAINLVAESFAGREMKERLVIQREEVRNHKSPKVADDLSGALPSPWAVVTAGTDAARLKATWSDEALILECSGGDLRENPASFATVVREMDGDFQFTARLTALELKGIEAEPAAGLFIQEDFHPYAARAVFAVDSAQTLWRVTRTRRGSPAEVAHAKASLPLWLRLVRDGSSLRSYTSMDGSNWHLDDLLGLRLAERAQVGFIAWTPDHASPAVARFDRINLSTGPPLMASVAKGVLLSSGTFLADGLISLSTLVLEASQVSLRCQGLPKPLTFAASKLARILYRPLTEADADALRGRTGVLLHNGDFAPGAVRSVQDGQITVESVLLGRHVYRAEAQVIAVVMRDPEPVATRFVVTTTDGSRLLATSLVGEPDKLLVGEPLLGPVPVPKELLVEIQAATPLPDLPETSPTTPPKPPAQ